MSSENDYNKIIKARSDAFLAYIGKAASERLIELQEEEEKNLPDVTVPKELDDKIRSMARQFQKEDDRKIRIKAYKKYGKIAAIFILVICVTFSVIAINVDAVRVRVLSFLFEDNSDYTKITTIETQNDSMRIKALLPQDWENTFYPEYLPKGYELAEAEQMGREKRLIFKNSTDQIMIFTQEYKEKADFIIADNEESEKGETVIYGKPAFWTSKKGWIILFWNQNGYSFSISAEMRLEELIKIAENMTLIK